MKDRPSLSSIQSRRQFMERFAVLAGLGYAAPALAGQCFDATKLPSSDISFRKALNFKEVSPDPKRVCAGCAFFTASGPGCGSCRMLSGGPVGANSVCDSWTAR